MVQSDVFLRALWRFSIFAAEPLIVPAKPNPSSLDKAQATAEFGSSYLQNTLPIGILQASECISPPIFALL